MKKRLQITVASSCWAKEDINMSRMMCLLALSTLLLCSCRSGLNAPQAEGFVPTTTPAMQLQDLQQPPYPAADSASPGYPRSQSAHGFIGDGPQANSNIQQPAYQPAGPSSSPYQETGFGHPSNVRPASHLELVETENAPLNDPHRASYGPEYSYRVQVLEPQAQQSAGAPPNIQQPWPRDEYLFDGGDREYKVQISEDWTVRGIDQEDTIAHYDTVDGETHVEPSNSVAIYSPRFASVRKVHNILAHEQHQASSGVDRSNGANRFDDAQLARQALRQANPVQSLGSKAANSFLDRQRGMGLDNVQILFGLTRDFRPYEDFRIIRDGMFDNSEKARLAKKTQSAFAWAGDQIVQVVLDEDIATPISSSQDSNIVVHYELPTGKSRLRVVKVASKDHAKPGDIIDFTIRFDNDGDQVLGNVTLIDNLTTRLEYVSESAESSLKSEFLTQENDGGSLVLRWEIAEPLEVGQGGVIRFQCRVR